MQIFLFSIIQNALNHKEYKSINCFNLTILCRIFDKRYNILYWISNF